MTHYHSLVIYSENSDNNNLSYCYKNTSFFEVITVWFSILLRTSSLESQMEEIAKLEHYILY